VVAGRIPAVRTIFENALAEKRARVEDRETDSMTGQRSIKVLRRMQETGERSIPRRSHRPTNNPLAYGRGHNLTVVPDAEEEETPIPENRTDHLAEVSEDESNDEVELGMLPPQSAQQRNAKA